MSSISIDGCHNLAQLFLKKCEERGDRIAMREKDFGIWQSYSWNDYRRYASEIAHGLLAHGLQRGDVISILSEDCKEWLFTDMGGALAGAAVNGIYPTYQPPQVQHALADSGCRFLFVEDEEQLDKYLAVEKDLPRIEKVWVYDWRGLRSFKHDKVAPIESLYEQGGAHLKAHPGTLQEIANSIKPDDLAVLVYTSGTTGRPKGAMLPHRYILFQMNLAPDHLRQQSHDNVLTYLPLCHVAERIVSAWLPIKTGATINFAEDPETVAQNLQELSPTYVLAVPRVWEKFYSRVSTNMAEATWLGQKTFDAALAIGMRRADCLIAGRQPGPGLKLAFWLADKLVFSNIKKALGLNRVERAVTGAAPISTALLKWFLALGVQIDELYGQTETGIVTATPANTLRHGSIGRALPGVEMRLSEQREILARSPGQFAGYLNLPEKTAETVIDGWVHTGDVGTVDEEGNFRILDRLKDIIITAGGKNVTPSLIENELKVSPYISDAVIIGDQRKYLSCLVMIDRDNVEHYAQTHAVPFTDYKSLCARPEIIKLIDGVIQQVNANFSPVEQIKKFRLIDVLLTAEDEELTPTMKLKRSFISERYAPLIDSMYGSA